MILQISNHPRRILDMSGKGEHSINKTINEMRELLGQITSDLEKSHNGNKAASQRVRTGTVKLEKVAKAYRKESIQHEKKTKGHKKTAKPAAKAKASAKKAPAHKAAAHKSAAKHAPAKKHAAKPAAKSHAKPAAKAKKSVAKPHAFALKRPTAKLPVRKSHSR
jgi:hypothetical protein